MAKITKRIEIVIEEDAEARTFNRTRSLTRNINPYELIGILESERIAVTCELQDQYINSYDTESEVQDEHPAS